MKLNCQIIVNDRSKMSLRSAYKIKPKRGCLTVGKLSTKKNELLILLRTQNNSCVDKYKGNKIEQIFDALINFGKATIIVKEPPHDLYIESDPILLKGFIRFLRLLLTNKIDSPIIKVSDLTTKKVLNAQIKKIHITKNAKYPTLKGFPRYTEELIIEGLNRRSFDLQILKLNNLRVLNLSNNQIRSLPKDLGSLPHLQELILSQNQIGTDDYIKWDWLDHDNIRKNLCLLDLSCNEIFEIPDNIGKLNSLVNLKLNSNKLTVLPQSIQNLSLLTYLNLSGNHLRYLPAGIRKLKLCEIDVSRNNFIKERYSHFEFNISVPSLVESAANIILSKSVSYDTSLIPRILAKYLDSAKYCPCGKACFQNYIKILLNFSLNMPVVKYVHELIPFEYYFCSARCCRAYSSLQ